MYHSKANNGQAGLGFLINNKWKDNITRVTLGNSRVPELVLRITDRYHETETGNFYNTIDKILEKQTSMRSFEDKQL